MNVDLNEPVDLDTMLSSGATYRQIDHWTRKGYLLRNPDERHPGSGAARGWTMREFSIVSLIVKMSRAGIATSTAAEWARDAVDRGTTSVTTDDGVTIQWGDVA